MYAVIETGGKQYKVQLGDIVQVEKLDGKVGEKLVLDKVLLVASPSDTPSEIILGKPFLSGAKVSAQIVGQGRDKKIVVFKYKTRKQYRKTRGHRQEQTQLLITSLDAGNGKTSSLSDEDLSKKLKVFQSQLKKKVTPNTSKEKSET